MNGKTIQPAFFEAMYARDEDPWHFATSAYENAKYDDTLRSLPQARYESILEVGCSVGVLTRRIADRGTDVLAIDVSQRALDTASKRCSDVTNVRFALSKAARGFRHRFHSTW